LNIGHFTAYFTQSNPQMTNLGEEIALNNTTETVRTCLHK
jgi:hypothetical protein